MSNDLNLNILPSSQLDLFELLSNADFISDFYLAGGTGLALQIGHRQSIDFDFFIPSDFDTRQIIPSIQSLGPFELQSEEKNTLNGILNHVRISFLSYKYSVLNPFLNYKNIKIAHELDISSMKVSAISGRGNKTDFIDLFFILKKYSLDTIFRFYEKKYGKSLSNEYHLIKSLLYFEDAEEQAMPKMTEKVEWERVKADIVKKVKESRLL